MAINDNTISLQQYKGEIRPCPLCSARTPNAALDALTSGRACKLCMGHSYVAMCNNCEGTGIYKGRTIWDGGRSEQSSTCTPCGGSGVFATRKPYDWVPPAEAKVVEAKVVEPAAVVVT